MQSVFVSYSHDDAAFADRLVLDLRESEVPATYDKWVLSVGDSIIGKIADTVADSDRVIALLSPTSVRSTWVKKELALAMTGEIENRGVKVLPAVIADCEIPSMLADKFHADFRRNYYWGLRKLLEALCPEFYRFEPFIRQEQIEKAGQELHTLLPRNDLEALRAWFSANGYALAALFGKLWAVSEAIPRFSIGTEFSDFIVINGQSFLYQFSLIKLGNPTWSRVNSDELVQESKRLEQLLLWCKDNDANVRHAVALRMASSYGAQQIAPGIPQITPSLLGHHLWIDAKLLCGRREEYGTRENDFRNEIYAKTNHAIEIVSYDRVLDALSKMGKRSQ